MTAYVSGNGLPLILEYPEDDVPAVAEMFSDLAGSGRVVVFNTRGQGQDIGVKVLVNFGLLPVLVVSPHDPDADENGEREPDARLLMTSYLDNRAL